MAVKIEDAQFSKEPIKSKFTILVAFYFAQTYIYWESFWMQDNICNYTIGFHRSKCEQCEWNWWPTQRENK